MHNLSCAYYFAVPTSPPTDFRVDAVSSTTIQLEWGEVYIGDQNGIITMYEVQYTQTTFQLVPQVQTVTVSATTLAITLTGLEEDVNYSIKIRAYTSIGPGPYSSPVEVYTLQDSEFVPYNTCRIKYRSLVVGQGVCCLFQVLC